MLFSAVPSLVLVVALVLACAVSTAQAASGRVLLLHSYHTGYAWTDAITAGVRSVLLGRNNPPELMVEHMDTKRQQLGETEPELVALYAARYKRRKPDVVVVSDNNALDFVLRHRAELFAGVPVVFCGINDVPHARLADVRGVTGVAEQTDIAGTLEAAFRIWPGTRRVVLVADDTPTSRAVLGEVEEVAGRLSRPVSLLPLANLGANELTVALAALPQDCVVLLISFFRDREGRAYTGGEAGRLVSGRSSVPVFCLWDFYLGTGVVGGSVVGGRSQGAEAARLALRILNGEAPGDIPVSIGARGRFLFDHAALARFDIDGARLPEGSEVINRPYSFYRENRALVLAGTAVAVAMFAVIAALAGVLFYRRRAERVVRASEGLHRGIFEASRDGIVLTDASGVVTAANPAFLRMFGLAPEEAAGSDLLAVLGGGAEAGELFEAIRAEGFADERSIEFARRDGLRFPGVARGWMGPGAGAGHWLGVHLLVRDMTERRRAEEMLLESERRLRTILDYAYDWEYWIGPDGCCIYTSPSCERITGYAPAEFMNDPLLLERITHPEDRDVVHRHLSAVLAREPALEDPQGEHAIAAFDFRILTRSGEERWIGHVCQPVWGKGGQYAGRRASNRDITAYKCAERALTVSEERLQFALTASHDGVWDFDPRTGEGYWGPRWYSMLGYEPDAFPATRERWLEMVHPEDRERAAFARDRLLRDAEDSFEIEVRMRTAAGDWAWMDVRGRVVARDPEGAPRRVVGTQTDISARKAVEEQLQEARMQAEQASMAKSAFLANMSHEVRTPISGILGVTEMLLTRADEADAGRLAMIRSSARSLLRIIDDILDLSRIEAGRLELRAAPFGPALLLARVRREFVPEAEERGVELIVRAGEDQADGLGGADGGGPVALVGDEDRLLQVLRNLTANALKYTDVGTVEVRGRVAAAGPGQGTPDGGAQKARLEFSVRDTGVGMSGAEAGAIFESFARVDAPHVRRQPGAGLGLAICRQLVERMGGDIRVTSRIGEGTVFTVALELPLADALGRRAVALRAEQEAAVAGKPNGAPAPPSGAEPPSTAAPSRGAPAQTETGAGRALNVLLAEDNAVNLLFIKHFLEQSGHRVIAAMNGRQALDALAEHAFDAVLMDVQMPGMDGLQATRAIRSGQVAGCDPAIPVIALTAYAMKGDRESFLEAGMNGYVSKPINFDELLAALRGVVAG
ncbi:MAG: PAS domain-containing protein [Desulfovibrionaceae bacterium]|nr:PAS domain-containing protein [Desulfovibrionaceae bacterium]